jgi:tetratricopeptide (TPR) repeat protein
MLGRFDEARALHRRAAAQAEDVGAGVQLAGVFMTGGKIELLADDAERAEAVLRAGCEHCERLGETGYLSTMAAMLAEALLRLDRDEEALEQTQVSERTAAADDVLSQVHWRSTRAKVLARAGEVEQAEQLAREAIPYGERTDYIDLQADALRALAEVLTAAGKPEEATAAAQQALELHERKGNAASAARAHALLDAIADPVER